MIGRLIYRIIFMLNAADALIRILPKLVLLILYVSMSISIFRAFHEGAHILLTSQTINPLYLMSYGKHIAMYIYYHYATLSAGMIIRLLMSLLIPYFIIRYVKIMLWYCMTRIDAILRTLIGYIFRLFGIKRRKKQYNTQHDELMKIINSMAQSKQHQSKTAKWKK